LYINNFCRSCTKPSDDEQEMTNDMIINLVSEQKEENEDEKDEVCTEVTKKM
jgi:hypothetical protein